MFIIEPLRFATLVSPVPTHGCLSILTHYHQQDIHLKLDPDAGSKQSWTEKHYFCKASTPTRCPSIMV